MTNIMLAAFNGTRYPDELLATIVRRVKTDSDDDKNRFIKLNDTRAGIINIRIEKLHGGYRSAIHAGTQHPKRKI